MKNLYFYDRERARLFIAQGAELDRKDAKIKSFRTFLSGAQSLSGKLWREAVFRASELILEIVQRQHETRLLQISLIKEHGDGNQS